jgi:RNA polymerase sigma-70 factor, ECF subfamily
MVTTEQINMSLTPELNAELEAHLRACLRGDLARFEDVVKVCEPRVRAVLAAMTPDGNAVPDLTQEVFVIAYQRLAKYQTGTNFLAWVTAIARNVAQNERRRWYRRQDLQQRYQADTEQRIADPLQQFVDGLPEEVLESLRACVNGLGGRTRSLVDGYYFEGRPLQRLADALQLSATAAKVALHRARQAVGKCLRQKGPA